jgi:hypothetical protein
VYRRPDWNCRHFFRLQTTVSQSVVLGPQTNETDKTINGTLNIEKRHGKAD